MPFIKDDRRVELDPKLQELWDEITLSEPINKEEIEKSLGEIKSELNYCFYKLLVTLTLRFGLSYERLSAIRAVLLDVYDEYTKKFMSKYEDAKRRQHGDISSLSDKHRYYR